MKVIIEAAAAETVAERAGSGTAGRKGNGMAHDGSARLVARAGVALDVRPVRPGDEAALEDFFSHVTPQDLRFRFLGGVRQVSHDRLVAMTHVDHHHTENFLAFADDGQTIVATAILGCDAALNTGDVAISVRADFKHKGVAWEMLRHVARYAEAKGVKALESIESRENHEAIELEKEQGFVAEHHPDDATLVVIRKAFRRD